VVQILWPEYLMAEVVALAVEDHLSRQMALVVQILLVKGALVEMGQILVLIMAVAVAVVRTP
jgi:hypothetical protein